MTKEMKLAIKIAGKVDSSLKAGLSSVHSGIAGIAKIAAKSCAVAATAIAGLGAAAIKVGKEYEKSMSQVAATMAIDKSTEEGMKAYETLSNAAKEMGATTAFTASEAAEGLNYLALAGYNAEQAATALPYTLKLAGAGAMDLASASDMVTDAMSALNLEANEQNLSAFADQLAKSASKTNTSVAQLGEAILTVGGTAANLKGGTAELNAALGVLANNGIKGAEGGTALRNMLLSLEAPTAAAQKQLKDLGVNVYDAEGNLRSINDIFSDLKNGMAGMSQEEMDSVFSTIFNKRDLKSARAMMKSAGEEFSELEKTIEQSAGACDQMYATQLDNLEGDISIFTSALQGLGIEVYENIGGSVRDAVKLGTSSLGKLTDAFKEGGLSGLVGAFGEVLSDVLLYVADLAPKLLDAGINMINSLINGILSSSDQLADSAVQVASKLLEAVTTIAPKLLQLFGTLLISLASSLAAELPSMLEMVVSGIGNLGNMILELLPQLLDVGIELLMAVVDGVLTSGPELFQTIVEIINTLISQFNTYLPNLLQIGISLISQVIYGILSNLPMLIQAAMQLINTFVSFVLQNLPIILSAGFELLWAIVNGIMNNLDMIISAAITLVMELVAGLLENLPLLISCAIQLIIALAAGLIQAIPQIIAAIPQIIMAIINGFAETDWGSIGKDIINGLKDGLLACWNSLKETAQNIWNSIKNIFSKKVEVNASVSGDASANAHAAGGIFRQPTLLSSVNGANHLVGEAGPEAILPLDTLWQQMSNMYNPAINTINNKLNILAERIGADKSEKTIDTFSDTPPITYSPTIIIQGNANKEDVEEALSMSQEEFERMYVKMVKDHDRTKF